MADASTQGLVAMLTQLRDLWTRQSKRRKTAAFAVVLGVLGWVGYTTLAHHTDAWVAVADGASPDDSQEMYAMLQSRSIPARLHEGKVEVPEDCADEARAAAASSGLPHSGKGFELFDGNNLGQSSFAEQVNFRRALQGELSRSITALAQVDGARVHLALGRRSVFKEQDEAPSASVALHLHAGQVLTSSQVRGVRELVAASVEGLKADAVVIVDNHGNLLDSNEPNGVDHKAELEHNVTTRVRTMLERVVGPGKVSVVATADVDDRKISETEDVYDKDHTAIRSESRTVEGVDAMGNAGSSVGGIAGARGNLPGAPGATTTPGTPNGRLQETKNYEVTHTVRQTVTPEAQLQRLHVAIVVDYKTDAKGKPVPAQRAGARRADRGRAASRGHRRHARRQDRAALDSVRRGSRSDRGSGCCEPTAGQGRAAIDSARDRRRRRVAGHVHAHHDARPPRQEEPPDGAARQLAARLTCAGRCLRARARSRSVARFAPARPATRLVGSRPRRSIGAR